MYDQTCMYCTENQQLQELMLYVCHVEGFPLYLFKDQTYLGRCILAYNEHERKVSELSENQFVSYCRCIQKIAKMIEDLFRPYQTNIAMFGDKVSHLHCHLVPKYEGGTDFGGMFQMSPVPSRMLNEKEYDDIIRKMREYFHNIA